MLGDDPDPTVTIVWFGFGEVSDARKGSERVRRRQGGERGNYERMQILKHDGNEVPMQCK